MRPGLSHAWGLGGGLFRTFGRFDATSGVSTWEEALEFLAEVQPTRPIAQVQFWGHGKWGSARVAGQSLDRRALDRSHALGPRLHAVRDRMEGGEHGLWWWRTCETFGAREGHAFARDFAEFLDCRVAGHTYIIGHVQSGLHSLRPGARPHWSDEEGIREGTPEAPREAYWSRIWRPNTITFLRGDVPAGY
jgi:hypothetical protein